MLVSPTRKVILQRPPRRDSREGSGYGTSSLRQDVDELDELLDHLVSEARPPHPPSDVDGAKIQPRDDIVLIGHSTGCQDSVFYMKHGRPDLRRRVKGVVLQAPVSDREGMALLPETEASRQKRSTDVPL